MNAGQNKLRLQASGYTSFVILTMLAGVYIAFGGTLSLIIGYGFPGLTADNPALQKLLSGAMFPIGLILVVVLGAELFTGNNALLMPPLMAKKMLLARRARKLGARVSRKFPRGNTVCTRNGLFCRTHGTRALPFGDNRHRTGKSLYALARGDD